MMSQNREAQKDRLRADLDYQVNLKNEMLLGEILRLLQKREKDARRSGEARSDGVVGVMEGRASTGKLSFSLRIPGHDLAVTRTSLNFVAGSVARRSLARFEESCAHDLSSNRLCASNRPNHFAGDDSVFGFQR